jgi:hypothetical protein
MAGSFERSMYNLTNEQNIVTPPAINVPLRADISQLPIRHLINGAKSELKGDVLDKPGKRFEISKRIGTDELKEDYKPVSVIVYLDGLLFTGEDTIFGVKTANKIWKKISFGDIQSIMLEGDATLKITFLRKTNSFFKKSEEEITYTFKKLESKPIWDAFLCFLADKTRLFIDIRSNFLGDLRQSCVKKRSNSNPSFNLVHNPLLGKAGGRRKTKRSKRSRRNKKCKRYTRRS